jgi:hypothetical protein
MTTTTTGVAYQWGVGVVTDAREQIDTERLLIWAIKRQMADVIVEAADNPGLGWDGRGVSSDGIAAILDRARLGTNIDGHGVDAGNLPLHPDAEQVYRVARELLDPPTLILVRDCARGETRPDWNPYPPFAVRPVRIKHGDRAGQVRVFRTPGHGWAYCGVEFEDQRAGVEQYRLLWLWWHEGVRRIEAALMDDQSLERYRVVRWPVVARPWEE